VIRAFVLALCCFTAACASETAAIYLGDSLFVIGGAFASTLSLSLAIVVCTMKWPDKR
jgi:hypothetical protein